MKQIYLQRVDKFIGWMKNNEITLALITSPINIYYFTGFYSNPHERFMGLFIHRDGPILILPELDLNQAKNSQMLEDIYGYSDSEGPDSLLKNKIKPKGNEALGLEENLITLKRANWLKSIFNIELTQDIGPGLAAMRLLKDEIEIKNLQEAAHFADKAVGYGISALEVGKSELEIIAEIEYRLKKQGIERMSFETMVLTGKKTGLPHGRPGMDTIETGDFVMFDLGVVVNGYCSDITRTVVMGKKNERQKEMYNTVLKAQLLAIQMAKAGIKAKDIDLAARNYIKDRGYGEYFNHRIGHGLGLEVHEIPSIHEKNSDTIQSGMVFTVEPGIYLPNYGGVRIEDDILITDTGSLLLTSYTKELIYV